MRVPCGMPGDMGGTAGRPVTTDITLTHVTLLVEGVNYEKITCFGGVSEFSFLCVDVFVVVCSVVKTISINV